MTRYILQKIHAVRYNLMHYKRVLRMFDGFNSPSYCQDRYTIKPKTVQFLDYLYVFFILRMSPANYHLFRFDTMDRKHFKNYMDEPHAPLLRPRLWNSLWSRSTYILVHDKYLFQCLCEHHGLPVPRIYGVFPREAFKDKRIDLKEFMTRNNTERIVIKPTCGLMGRDIQFVSSDDVERNDECVVVGSDEESEYYLVQEVITQHPDLDTINPHSINSIRIISFLCSDNTVEFMAAMLRTSSTTRPVDNFSSGGIVIGIDLETGRLKKEGFSKPPHGTVFTNHPVTQREFLGFQIPYWEELREIASRAQTVFHYLKSVGWDFAITPRGPIIIEGNQDWGTAGIQAANGGLLTRRNRELFAQYGLHFPE